MKLKKIIYVLLIGFLFTNYSCKDNEPEQEPKTQAELLVGTWGKIRIVENGTINEFSECKQNGTTTFNTDGSVHDIPYVEYSGDCIIDGESDGNWVSENGIVLISFDVDIEPGLPIFEITETVLKLGNENNYLEYVRE